MSLMTIMVARFCSSCTTTSSRSRNLQVVQFGRNGSRETKGNNMTAVVTATSSSSTSVGSAWGDHRTVHDTSSVCCLVLI